tara:strand:- start:932 stop:2131 length:1200 start_codon:yes stop_codon:yes gene_type:complete
MSSTLQCIDIIEEKNKLGTQVYDFGLGENKIPISSILDKSIKKYSNIKNYTLPSGISELNEIIIKKNTNKNFIPQQILYGNGLKELIFILQMVFDGLIFHITPSWLSYKEQIQILGKRSNLIEINTIVSNNYKIIPKELDNILSQYKSYEKIIIWNNPNNPTGVLYTPSETKIIADIFNKYNTIVFADEIYSNICHHNEFMSISYFLPHLTIRGSSISKDLACGGHRLGWLVFPKQLEYLYNRCQKYSQIIYSCPSTMIQYALADFYKNETVVNDYYLLTNYIYEWAVKETYDILKNTKLLLSKPGGGWYIFIDFINYRHKFKNIKNSHELSLLLADKCGIISVAGENFGGSIWTIRLSLTNIKWEKHIELDNIQYNLDRIVLPIKEGCAILFHFLKTL